MGLGIPAFSTFNFQSSFVLPSAFFHRSSASSLLSSSEASIGNRVGVVGDSTSRVIFSSSLAVVEVGVAFFEDVFTHNIHSLCRRSENRMAELQSVAEMKSASG